MPHFRRGDVTREVDLIEEVARIDGLERLPATLPPRRGVAGRLSTRQRVRRRAEDALAARGLAEIAGWSFADPRLLDRLRLAAGRPDARVVAVENPLSEAQSILRPTLLGSLLDAAAHNVARGAATIALFESGTVFRAPRDGPLADEHHGLAVLLAGAVAPPAGVAGTPRAGRLLRRQGAARAVLGALGVEWTLARGAAGRSCIPGARRAPCRRSSGRGSASSASCTRWSPRAWDLTRGRGLGGRPRGLSPSCARGRAVPAVLELPAGARGHRRRRRRAVAAARCVAASASGRRRAARRARGLRRLPRRAGRGGRVSLALHLEFRAADRTLTDEDVAARARDRRRARQRARWQPPCTEPSRVIVVGAPATPGRSPRRCSGATRVRAGRGHRPRGRGSAPRRRLPVPPRAARARGARPRPRRAMPTRRSSPTRTAARRRWWRRCSSAACA